MFRKQLHTQTIQLRFKRWSRKGYAAFMSLHCQVSIGRLAVEISNRIGKKSNLQVTDESFLSQTTQTYEEGANLDPGEGSCSELNLINSLISNRLAIEVPAALVVGCVYYIYACSVLGQAFFICI